MGRLPFGPLLTAGLILILSWSTLALQPVRAEPAETPEALKRLQAEGVLTVRALRAWGALPEGYMPMLLDLQAQGLDILGLDGKQVAALAERARTEDGLERHRDDLQTLARLMADLGKTPPERVTKVFSGQMDDQWEAFGYNAFLSARPGFLEYYGVFSDAGLKIDTQDAGGIAVGMRSVEPLFHPPYAHDSHEARITLVVDPQGTGNAVVALLAPDQLDENEGRANVFRLALATPDGEPVKLSLTSRSGGQNHQMAQAELDGAIPERITLALRPGGEVLILDDEERLLLEGVAPDLLVLEPWHVLVMASGRESNTPGRLSLRSVAITERDLLPTPDPHALVEAPTKTVLFGGERLGRHWETFAATRHAYLQYLSLQEGGLRVDAPADQGQVMTGIRSVHPLVWLDRFQGSAIQDLTFNLRPEQTTGLVVALTTELGNERREPSDPFYLMHWRRDGQEGYKAHVQTRRNASLLESEPEAMPESLTFRLTPEGVRLLAPGFPDTLTPWDALASGQGLYLYVYSRAEENDAPVALALDRITLKRSPGPRMYAGVPQPGVSELPMTALFSGQEDALWDNHARSGMEFDDYARYTEAGLEVDVPASYRNSRAGIVSSERVINLDGRLDRTAYRVRLRFDPDRTDGFQVLFANDPVTGAGADAPGVSLVRHRHNRLTGKYVLELKKGRSSWFREIDAAWMGAHWDGTVDIELGERSMQVSLPGGLRLRGTGFSISDSTRWHMTVRSLSEGGQTASWDRMAPARMVLREIEAGWVTPMGMTAADYWELRDPDDFDPEAYLKALMSGPGSDLP
ncbi:hypothetical protein LRB11_14980 [Ectothiorhodospira haloalkaliphila]|uniref:hypothetical protein n=1 Tax=Ectothiorhodospira haloalkaliphila TaxID=421628 RepID=UPI001EE81B55|nr:hypothetical protein [Ectothiorhodospira haloalkaliphila]MCG5526218.1 hypothetical protein [Ectothiorhodospira haloalkaliphila]